MNGCQRFSVRTELAIYRVICPGFLVKNRNFWSKIEIFGQKSKFLAKNDNSDQKINFVDPNRNYDKSNTFDKTEAS